MLPSAITCVITSIFPHAKGVRTIDLPVPEDGLARDRGTGYDAGMQRLWLALLAGVLLAVPGVMSAPAQNPPAPAEPAATPLLTLSSPMIRSGMDRMNLLWLIPEKVPDFRLKLERPAWGPLTAAELESRLRGVEVRLPLEGLWVGYETPADGEASRATLSIQRGF